MEPLNPSRLQHVLDRGALAWPTVVAAVPEVFSRYLATSATSDDVIDAHGQDLYLACACAEGLDGAVEAFENGPLRLAIPAVFQVTKNLELQSEVLQRTRVKLLVGHPPLITTYSGVGSLASWVRVVAVRIALDLVGEEKPMADIGILDGLGMEPSSKSGFIGGEYRTAMEAALKSGLGALSPRERTLLRLHFLDRLSIDRLAELQQVHRATVARWLVQIRTRVFDHVKALLGERLKMTTSEVRSLWRALGGDVDASVSRILRS